MAEQLAISIISLPDLRLFMYVCACLCLEGAGCFFFAVVPQQLNPSNFKKNKHSLVAGGKLRGAENFRKNKVLGGTTSCLMMFANYAARHFLGKHKK